MGADGPHRGDGGFTLLEMLVALSIISMVLTVRDFARDGEVPRG